MHLSGTHVTAVDHVEDLQEDEGVPDQCEMEHLGLSKLIILNRLSGAIVRSVTKDSTSSIHDHHHDHSLEDNSAEDLAVHEGGQELFLTSGVLGNVSRGAGGGKSQSAKNIHDQVDVDQLHSVETRFCHCAVADKHHNEYREVASHLELNEALDVQVNISAPHHGTHARVKLVRLQHHRGLVSS